MRTSVTVKKLHMSHLLICFARTRLRIGQQPFQMHDRYFSLTFDALLFDNIISFFERSCRRYGHDRCLSIRHVTYAWRNAVAREALSPPTYRLRNTSRRRCASATCAFLEHRALARILSSDRWKQSNSRKENNAKKRRSYLSWYIYIYSYSLLETRLRM